MNTVESHVFEADSLYKYLVPFLGLHVL